MHISSTAAEVPVKFQNDWTILNLCFMVSRFHQMGNKMFYHQRPRALCVPGKTHGIAQMKGIIWQIIHSISCMSHGLVKMNLPLVQIGGLMQERRNSIANALESFLHWPIEIIHSLSCMSHGLVSMNLPILQISHTILRFIHFMVSISHTLPVLYLVNLLEATKNIYTFRNISQ